MNRQNAAAKKIGKMNEAAWVIGIFVCSLGVCLCTKADFGLSMIAAPPYILHYALRGIFPWFTQGRAEYVWQAVLLLGMCLAVRRFRWRYLLSFGTAVIAGRVIDLWFLVLGGNAPYETMPARIAAFAAGVILTAIAIAFTVKVGIRSYEASCTKDRACSDVLDVNRCSCHSRLNIRPFANGFGFHFRFNFFGDAVEFILDDSTDRFYKIAHINLPPC